MKENDFKIGDKVIIHCNDTRDEYKHKFYDNQIGKIIHIYDLDRNPWGNIVVILENMMQDGFFAEELEPISTENYTIMKQYIDKSDLIAKIKELTNEAKIDPSDFDCGRISICKELMNFIDGCDVKNVDLEKEVDKWYNTKASKEFNSVLYRDIEKCAKYFFELGISLNNPVTAADRGTAEEIIFNLKRVERDYHIDLTREMEWLRNKVKKGE